MGLLSGLVVVLASAGPGTGQGDHGGHMTPEGGMDSGDMHQGDSWEHTFNEEGTFHYLCHPHPYMTAEIVVSHDAPETNQTVDVRIANYSFQPDELHIRPGTTVRWTNQDPAVHTVTETGDETGEASTPGLSVLVVVAGVGAALVAAARRTRRR